MPEFTVIWRIDICADSALEAAKEAFECMQEKGTTATFFDVKSKTGEVTTIDLMNVDEKEETFII